MFSLFILQSRVEGWAKTSNDLSLVTPKSMEGMERCSANCVSLTPITFLERSAAVYGDRASLVYGRVRYTWRDTLQRCTRLASALVRKGISRGDVVRIHNFSISILCLSLFLVSVDMAVYAELEIIWLCLGRSHLN